MVSKKKILIVLVVGILIGGLWILSGHKMNEDKSAFPKCGFSINDERILLAGILENAKGGFFGTQIPKSCGEKIYRFHIKGDTYTTDANMMQEKETTIPEDSYNKYFFFVGSYKSYEVNRLIKENPFTGWLKERSSAFLTVFEIDSIIPLENNEAIISLETPKVLTEEFVISVTVKNVLQRDLLYTRLHVFITQGPFKITVLEDSGSEISSKDYWNVRIKRKYDAGEEKKYTFKIEPRIPDEQGLDKLNISASFKGYALKENTSTSEIIPLYSKEVREYQNSGF